jgi:translation initiation factor 2 alpha subunit (eIF-2alpha)
MNRNWYLSGPDVDDVITFTVVESDDVGFKVTIDAYSDRIGSLPFSELSAKKIKKNPASFLRIGSKHCGLVTDATGAMVYISLKNVTEAQKETENKLYSDNAHMFSMCQKLSFLGESEDTWFQCFRNALEHYRSGKIETHPYRALADRESRLVTSLLTPNCARIIQDNHALLFGIKPHSLTTRVCIVTFHMYGNDLVKSNLLNIRESVNCADDLSDKELYEHQDKANVSIQPVSLPEFQITISAYQENVCRDYMDKIVNLLKQIKVFDIVDVK